MRRFADNAGRMPHHNGPRYPGLGFLLRMHEAGEAYPLGMHPNCERAKSDMIYVREVAMMMVMDRLMDKPGWEQKVFDEEIAGKWIEEALALPDDLFLGDGLPAEKAWEDIDEDEDEDEDIDEDGDRDGEGDDEDDGMEVGNKEENKENEDDGARPMTGATSSDSWNDSGSDVRDYDWSRGPRQWKMKKLKKVLTRECMEYCIKELQAKAEYFKTSGIIPTLDATFSVAKSDTLVTDDLHKALLDAFERLKTDQADRPDWHPATDQKVLDLVHPSMYPLIYGRSRVLIDEVVGVGDAIYRWAGKGEIIPHPGSDPRPRVDPSMLVPLHLWSDTYQWLPANVSFVDGGVRFTSYVNNLHPVKYLDIYHTIQRLIETALPLWDQCLRQHITHGDMRPGAGRSEPRFPKPEPGDADDENPDNWEPAGGPDAIPDEVVAKYNWDDDSDCNESEFDSDEDKEEHIRDTTFKKIRRPIQPTPPAFKPPANGYAPRPEWTLRNQFKDTGLQIIVKIASIELTPEKPSYSGGGWHVEGQMNEHIAGTAIYYLDCENVTASHLEFAACTFEDVSATRKWASVGQDHYHWLEHVFGFQNNEAAVQHYGSVETRERRLLAFPNVFQHRVSPFELRDKTKPGHRRFAVLWLVDPFMRIISTANVPPQRADWWAESVVADFDDTREGTNLAQTIPPEVLRLLLENTADDPATLDRLLAKVETPPRLPNEIVEHIRKEVGDAEGPLMSRQEAERHREDLMAERKAVEKESSRAVWSETYSFCEH